MSIPMPCTCVCMTQVKTRVGWVSTFEHTSLILVLGCRLIFGRPYIPEIGIGKKLIFSGVLPLPGYLLVQGWYYFRLYKPAMVSAQTRVCTICRPIYKTNTHKYCGGRILLRFEHCPQGLFRLGRPLHHKCVLPVCTNFDRFCSGYYGCKIPTPGEIVFFNAKSCFWQDTQFLFFLCCSLAIFGMMSLAALTCHLGEEDSGRLQNDNERSKAHHGFEKS